MVYCNLICYKLALTHVQNTGIFVLCILV